MAVSVAATYISTGSGTMTLDELYTDAVADTPGCMTKTGSGPYVYTIIAPRRLYLSSGTLNMSNEGDTLQWTLTGNKAPGLEIPPNATFNIARDCTLIGDTTDTYYNYAYIYGIMNCSGESGHEITLDKWYSFRFYSYATDPSTWAYVDITNFAYGGTAPGMYFTCWRNRPTHSFTYINIETDDDYGYAFTLYPGDYTGMTFDNITVNNTQYGIRSYGACIKFTNSTFRNIKYYQHLYAPGSVPRYTLTGATRTPGGQPKITFEDCTFQDNYDVSSSERAFYLAYGCVIKFKDCTFAGVDDACRYGLSDQVAGGVFLFEGTTTFTNVTTPYYFANSVGGFLHVKTLDMDVVDMNGTAIEGATVSVVHMSGWEADLFLTDSSGDVLDIFGDNPVFVKEAQTGAATTAPWSDDVSAGLAHQITVSKAGFLPEVRTIEFDDGDATLTVALRPDTSALPANFS